MVYDMNGLIGWKISGMMYLDEIYEVVLLIFYLFLFVFVLVIVIGIIVMVLIICFIIKLFKQFVILLKQISEGDLIEMIEI